MKHRIAAVRSDWDTKPAGIYMTPYDRPDPHYTSRVVMLDADDPRVAAFLAKNTAPSKRQKSAR
ncbi:hypothetical protein [Geminisphaera colitermitum]|uniref:hypothetical protein n=1 Tax=Geminisphaera colitermitum TaxID=1148786 RepID=UPI00019652D1|nr:hypothetical protein [Geminisphaera colitermitum]